MAQPAPPVILVASDLRDQSDYIIQAAAAFAQRVGAALHVCHVIEQTGWFTRPALFAVHAPTSDMASDIERSQRLERLRHQVKRNVPTALEPASVEIIATSEPTYLAILSRAAEVGATLIALGPHGGTATSARFLGTTAERIIRTASIPCLLLRGPVVNPPARIGAAVDLSDCSATVLAEAAEWAARCSEAETPEVDVLYVGWWVEKQDNPKMEDTVVRPALEKAAEDATALLGEGHSAHFRPDVRWENEPIQPILSWAAGRNLDLIVVGTHGARGLQRALLGSTAVALSRASTLPVLLVPPPTAAT